MNDLPKTIFCDIDGVLIAHTGDVTAQPLIDVLLPGVHEKLLEWERKGYRIILVSGRKESTRAATENQLSRLRIVYDALLLGLGGGDRIIINDRKLSSENSTCFAINVERNKGLSEVEI